METRLGFFYEKYQYEDSLIFLKSQAAVITIPYSKTLNYHFRPNHSLFLQLTANSSWLVEQHDASIHKAALLASYSIDKILKRFDLKASVQKEVTTVFDLPFTGNISLHVKLSNWLRAYASVSTNYRTPTLNELYYNPGGNINLKPETGKNLEGGLQINKKYKRHLLSGDFALYNRKVKNWITWYGSSILTPHNIQQVWSRGVESIINYEMDLSKKIENIPTDKLEDYMIEIVATKQVAYTSSGPKLLVGLLYSYSLSTTEESAILNDYSIGKQIPYVPRYQAKGNIGFRYKGVECSFVQTYTGYRFVTTDESQFLKPYFTSNVFASWKLPVRKNVLQATLRFNNLFNAQYESIIGRVMPGRNLSVGLMWEMR